jgi:hypothetical protein
MRGLKAGIEVDVGVGVAVEVGCGVAVGVVVGVNVGEGVGTISDDIGAEMELKERNSNVL